MGNRRVACDFYLARGAIGEKQIKRTHMKFCKSLILLVPPAGIGPAAHGLGIQYQPHHYSSLYIILKVKSNN